LRQRATANCAAPLNASAGQYATLNCKPLLFSFPCKWRYINVGPFNVELINVVGRSIGLHCYASLHQSLNGQPGQDALPLHVASVIIQLRL